MALRLPYTGSAEPLAVDSVTIPHKEPRTRAVRGPRAYRHTYAHDPYINTPACACLSQDAALGYIYTYAPHARPSQDVALFQKHAARFAVAATRMAVWTQVTYSAPTFSMVARPRARHRLQGLLGLRLAPTPSQAPTRAHVGACTRLAGRSASGTVRTERPLVTHAQCMICIDICIYPRRGHVTSATAI